MSPYAKFRMDSKSLITFLNSVVQLNSECSEISNDQLESPSLAFKLHACSLTLSGWLLGRRVPGVLEQRLQDSIPVFRPELFLADHLRDHLLTNARKALLFAVENHHTWMKVAEGSVRNDVKFKTNSTLRSHSEKSKILKLAFTCIIILTDLCS